MLEHHREQRDRARDVPWKRAQRCSFAHIRVDEFPEMEMRRERQIESCFPRGHLVEIARQMPCDPSFIAKHATRNQRVPVRASQPVSIRHAEWKRLCLKHAAPPSTSRKTKTK